MQEDRHPNCRPAFWSSFWSDFRIAALLFVILSVAGSSFMALGAPPQFVLPIVFTIAVGMPAVLVRRYHTALATHAGVKLPFQSSGPSLLLGLAGVATVLLVKVHVMRAAWNLASRHYSSGIGEIRTLKLSDNSVAILNTQSRIRWIGSREGREVALEEGEVLFEVAHDATRPFRVTAGNVEICDLATEFDVYRKRNGTIVVTVLSGRVTVRVLTSDGTQPDQSGWLLKPNEQMEHTSDGMITNIQTVPASRVVQWREGMIEADDEPFAILISELNRYSTKPILIADRRLEAAHITLGGKFSVRDVPATLKLIQLLSPIVVTDTGDSYVLTYRDHAS